jgi:hypothetical protein
MRRKQIVGAGILLLATFSPIQLPAEAAGRSTTAVVNTILNGRGSPKSSLGIDGDFYIDTRSLLIYGPKKNGKWPTPQSIQGPTGPSGSDGRNGSDGKTASSSNVNTVVGPPGIQGPIGPAGPQGEKGEQGLPGIAGAVGPAGSPGPAGPTGANGSNGAQGPVGATGAKGETGTSGITEVTVIEIKPITLSTSSHNTYSSSEPFGNLIVDQSYQFEIFLRGASLLPQLVLGVDLLSAGNELNFNYLRSDFEYATYTGSVTSYGFLISGTLKVRVPESGLIVRVIDGRGETSAVPLVVTGKAYITPVGVIK